MPVGIPPKSDLVKEMDTELKSEDDKNNKTYKENKPGKSKKSPVSG